MADFKAKLTMLAERGHRVGSEEMIERVEAILAEQPVVVAKQRKRLGMPVQTEENPVAKRRGRMVAVGAFVAVLLLGVVALFIANRGGGDGPVATTPTTTTLAEPTTTVDPAVAADLAVIDEYLTAWHAGDVERAFEMIGADPDTSPGSAGWSQYEGMMGASVELACAPRSDEPGAYDCDLAYSNALHEAVDAAPQQVLWSARVQGDSIEVLDVQNQGGLMESWLAWQSVSGLDEESPCDEGGPPSPDCAEFQQEHLDEWAVWYLDNS